MDRPKLEVADVFRRYGEAYRQEHGASLSTAQRRVMTAIEVCRTAALGGHLEQCDQCGHRAQLLTTVAGIDIAQNASRLARAQWIEDRQSELLEIPVFSRGLYRAAEIAAIAYQNKEVVYGILFQATAETMSTIAADPKHLGAEIGFFAVLHTWGQTLHFHPHLHCVVPGGGISPDGQRWVSCRPGSSYPSPCCPACSGACFWNPSRKPLTPANCSSSAPWNPFGTAAPLDGSGPTQSDSNGWSMPSAPSPGPQQVLDYVGRYTHRVAISNNRLLDIENGQVQFQLERLSSTAASKTMTLAADEFIRRFLLHVFRTASNAFATMASWQTVTGDRSWSRVANSWE